MENPLIKIIEELKALGTKDVDVRHVVKIKPYPFAKSLQRVLEHYQIPKSVAVTVSKCFTDFQSKDIVILPFFENNDERKSFIRSLPQDAQSLIWDSPTRKTNHEMIVGLLDVIKTYNAFILPEQIEDISEHFYGYDFWKNIKDHASIEKHTVELREKLEKFCKELMGPLS